MERSAGTIASGGTGVAVRTRPPQEATQSARATEQHPPARASDLQLLGRFERSGHRRPPSLVRRADGQVVQLTPLLYAVLEAVDGRRDEAAVAAAVAERTGKIATPDDIRCLLDEKLRPLGLLQQPDGSQPATRRANPLLGLRLRMVVGSPRVTGAIAAPFAKLFVSPVVTVMVLAFLALTGWVLFNRGLGQAMRDALYEPRLLLLVFALTIVSAGFHELGHAAACRYGGGKPGSIGVGLYLVWPAFYTDVTDAYRLDRRARLRVDLGGIYFNAIFAVIAFGLWAATRWEALLVIVPLQALQVVRQLIPLVRLDGYHILADLTGVPDLFAHIKPILLGMLPSHWGRAENRQLRPWVRAVVTGWVLVVVPLLAAVLVVIAVVLPRVAATAWDSLGRQRMDVAAAWSTGDAAAVGTSVLSLLAIAVPVLSMGYLLARVLRRTALSVWRGTAGHRGRRAVALLVAGALIAGLATVWWPDGQYRPIGPDERWRLSDVAAGSGGLVGAALASDRLNSAPQVEPAYASRPGVLGSVSADQVSAPPSGAFTAAETSALKPSADGGSGGGGDFRFTLPPPPDDGDNQALAVNYTDGSALVVMALSLVFATEELVDHSNEAYALASCTDCLAAAIAFQLVIILDQADIVVPQNIAVAVGAHCVRCATYALAAQLIVTVDDPLSDEAMEELESIWSRLEALEEDAENISLEELRAALAALEAQFLELLADEGALASAGDEEATAGDETEATPSPTSEPSPSPTSEPSPSPSSDPTPSPTSEPSPSPTSDPSPSPSSDPSPSPSSEPSPTGDGA